MSDLMTSILNVAVSMVVLFVIVPFLLCFYAGVITKGVLEAFRSHRNKYHGKQS